MANNEFPFPFRKRRDFRERIARTVRDTVEEEDNTKSVGREEAFSIFLSIKSKMASARGLKGASHDRAAVCVLDPVPLLQLRHDTRRGCFPPSNGWLPQRPARFFLFFFSDSFFSPRFSQGLHMNVMVDFAVVPPGGSHRGIPRRGDDEMTGRRKKVTRYIRRVLIRTPL